MTTIRLRPIRPPSAGLDVSAVGRLLDGEHAGIRARVRELTASLDRPDHIEREAYRELVLDWTRRLAAEGIGTLAFPRPWGSGDPAAFAAAFSELAHFDLSLLTKAGVQFGLFGGAIGRLGTEEHHRRYLPGAGTVDLPGCFAMTETAHGSNVRNLETTATYSPGDDSLIIDTPHDLARKDYIGNAARHGRVAVVFARLIVAAADHGIHAVVVPIRDAAGAPLPGVLIEDDGDKEGLNGVDNGRIWFSSVAVPRTNLLDRYGGINPEGRYRSPIDDPDKRFFTMIGTLVGGRIGVGSAAVSVAKSALAIAVRYANRRRQFGPEGGSEWSLIDYPLHQVRLMPRLASTYAYHFAFEELIARYGAGDEGPDLDAAAAGLKAFATWHAIETVQAAREATGGQGYLSVNRLGAMRADSDIFVTYEGDNNVLVQLVARSLLADLRQRTRRRRTGAAYLLGRTGRRLVERVPFTRARALGRRLDLDRLGELLAEREAHSLDGLARRLRSRLREGTDPFEAFTEVQWHAVAVARAHVERRVFDAARRAVEGAPEVSDVLGDLVRLFAAGRIEADLGWFLEHRVIARAGAFRIHRLVARLSAEVARHSIGLVDAFQIPDRVLAAPIALGGATS